MLFDEADQNQFPQCRGRHGLVHVAGPGVPPGTSAIVSRCGRTLRGYASPNEFLPPCQWSLPLPPENRSHLAANPFTELIKTRLYLCHPVICYPAPQQLLQLFTDLSQLAASSPAKLLLKVQINRPPGVIRMTFAPSTRRIYARPVRVTSGFRSLCPLAYLTVASYAVRVPRVRASPTASFPHCLTTLQLLFSSGFLSPSLPENSHLLVTSSFGFHLWVPSAMPGAQTKEAVLIRTLLPLRCSRNGTRFIYSYTALAVWRCRCQ